MSERERDFAPLSTACVKGLCDKLYERRKIAGVEIEKMVKDFHDAKNSSQLKKLIKVLGQDLMTSTNTNVKNGALMGLSSVAVGLGKDCVNYLPELIHPIIACFNEAPRVRYQAVESLFNVVKIARGSILEHFPVIFDSLAKLSSDPEQQVIQAAELLDRLLKDIVTESPNFDVASFIPQLRERMYSRAAPVRQLVISWLAALDAVPTMDLLPLLPSILDPLFKILDDPNPEIRRMCEVQLSQFLRAVKREPERASCHHMINVLIVHAQSPEELLQLTAIAWLKQFAELMGRALLPHAAAVLAAALPCLAYCDEPRRNIRETAATVNLQLSKLVSECSSDPESKPVTSGDPGEVTEKEESLDVPAVVGVLVQMMHHSSVHTKAAALDWILLLYGSLPAQMSLVTGTVFPGVVDGVVEPADDVARRALAAVAEICSVCRTDSEESPYYDKFLKTVLCLLAADESLLDDRLAFIVRNLSVLMSPEAVYRAFGRLIPEIAEQHVGKAAGAGVAAGQGAGGSRFAAAAVDVLSTMLLTAAELHPLRRRLRAFDDPSTVSLFVSLYECWAHSPVSLLALCLLTHNYTHCCDLIHTFGDLEITVDFLTEIDKLVQLIESPIFAYLRLELLRPTSGPLRRALSGVLMLLPQSEAFHTLRRRLHAVPAQPPDQKDESPRSPAAAGVDFDSLLEQFRRIQLRNPNTSTR